MSQYMAAGSALINAAGTARVQLGPVPTWQRWRLTSIGVRVDSGDEAEARVYVGEVNDSTFLEGTYSGNRDSSQWPLGALELEAGESLTVEWTGGTEGARATATARYQSIDTRRG